MSDLPPANDIRALLEDSPHIDDAGFSDRVVRVLPRRRPAMASSYAIVPAVTVLACALAYGGRTLGGGHPPAAQGAHHALSLLMTTSFLGVALALLLVAMGAMLTAEE